MYRFVYQRDFFFFYILRCGLEKGVSEAHQMKKKLFSNDSKEKSQLVHSSHYSARPVASHPQAHKLSFSLSLSLSRSLALSISSLFLPLSVLSILFIYLFFFLSFFLVFLSPF
jgi:hypothetical protein